MSAYIISVCEITNMSPAMKQYAEASAALIRKQGGRYLVRGRPVDVIEGSHLNGKLLIVTEFPTMAQLRAFWDSEDYQKIRPLRQGTGIYDIGIFESPPPDKV